MAVSFQGFRSLVENSPDAISLIDTSGEILYGSASIEKIFGYEPAEIIGRNCLELIHPEDREHVNGALLEVLATPPGTFQWEVRVRHKDGSYCWVESTLSNLLSEPDVNAIVMQQRDINARRAAENEKQRIAAELASSNARLEEFARIAAHDLKEPLHTVSLYAELMLERTQMDAAAKQMSQIVVQSAARMATLIESLLAFASSGVHAPARFIDLKYALAQATQNLVVPINSSGARITVGRLPIVRSNETLLVSLFQNLISNAVKYHAERPLEIEINAERGEPGWTIRIKDNGVGISEDNQTLVFLPFVRLATKAIPGCGLGLAVCKKIVEELGGSIWIESEVGKGSTFCFTLVDEDECSHGEVV